MSVHRRPAAGYKYRAGLRRMASCWQQRQVSPCLRLSSTTEWLSFQLFIQIQFIDRVLRAGCTTETGFTVQTVQKTAEIPQVRAQIGRQIPDVNHISQRKVGQNGRVRITVDLPESVIPEATSHSYIWSRSSLCATTGLLLYQSVEQWKSCLLCSPRKRGFLVVFFANHRDGSLSTVPMT